MSIAPPSTPVIFPPFFGDGDSPPRLSVEAYHQLAEQGLLENESVELVEGLLVRKMPKNPRHVTIVRRLRQLLEAMLAKKWHVRLQDPIALAGSEPEPDLAVIDGKEDDFQQRHPGSSEIGLVIEVSETTLRWDRGFKKRMYARAGVPVYWIVNLVDNQIEIHTQPSGPAQQPEYACREVFEFAAAVPVWLDGQTAGFLSVGEILS
ncbi:MAG: Uma2 family endonuclease [Pirellulaceae bacterium]